MLTTAIICILTILLMVFSVFRFPVVRFGRFQLGGYCFFSIIGALALLLFGTVTPTQALSGILADSDVNPVKILILFLTMTAFSVFLDELGFFRVLASITLKRAGTSQKTLFFLLYLIVSILTVFTSNDIIILTFTPFICAFARNANINPLPYLFCEFFGANTWSMALMIGNPTNIYVASFLGIDFFAYSAKMLLPTIVGGLFSILLLYLAFHKSLSAPITATPSEEKIKEKPLLIVGIVHLALCLVFLMISSYIGVPMWLVSLSLFISLFVIILLMRHHKREKPVILLRTLRRMPWELVPFMLSMFILVISLRESGISAVFSDVLENILGGNATPTFTYGIASYLVANLINNIPMSVLFADLATLAPTNGAIFGTIVGSNLGACMTPVGALAGIMWADILRREGVKFDYRDFVRYGILISIPTLILTLLTLHFVLI